MSLALRKDWTPGTKLKVLFVSTFCNSLCSCLCAHTVLSSELWRNYLPHFWALKRARMKTCICLNLSVWMWSLQISLCHLSIIVSFSLILSCQTTKLLLFFLNRLFSCFAGFSVPLSVPVWCVVLEVRMYNAINVRNLKHIKIFLTEKQIPPYLLYDGKIHRNG